MSSSSNSSWTLLTPEETAAAETLRPLTEGTERQDEPSALTEGDGERGVSEDDHLKVEETTTEPCEEAELSTYQPSSAPMEVLESPVPDEQAEDTTVDTALSNTDQEAFSDSYSHLTPTTEDCPAPPLTPETLGHLESEQDEQEEQQYEEEKEGSSQTDVQDQTQHQELHDEESKAETEPVTQSPLQTPQDSSVVTDSVTAQEAGPEVRRRRSLLEKIGRHEEEEEAEEDFQLPQREEESSITLNKCILGAVILLGLGTIFISGVFMDLDEESDYPSVDLKESEATGKQEWLNPAGADSGELLNALNKGNEQIAMLQSQHQPENEQLKVAQTQAAEGSTEQLQLEEVEKENTAISPPGGRTEDSGHRPEDQQVHRKDKHDRGVREEWKDKSEWKKEKKLRKDGGKIESKDKEWKKERYESDKSDKKHKDDKSSKHREDSREQKKDKSKRGDEGKPWKEKKEWNDRSDKKFKHDKFKEDKEWKNKQEWRDLKEYKHHGERHKGPGEKEWKKGRDVHKEDHKEKHERKHWKEREGHESGNRKDTGDRREWNKNGKDSNKWKKREDGRKWSEEEEWNGAEKQHQKDRREGETEKHKEHTWSERKPAHSHPKPSTGQPEYWAQQRERLQHSSKPLQPCDSPDTCAHTEGVRRVDYTEFEPVLQNYLTKALTAGVDAMQIEELKKLAAEMFQNGVFPHSQMSFQDYVEDLGDILEDLVDGIDSDENEDSAIEDEMEGFEREVMQKFTLSGSSRVKGEWREESGKGRA